MRILVAEDDEALGGFVRRGLEAENYAVDVSMDGAQVRSLAQQASYDLLLLDLNLPSVDGVAVLRQVRVERPSLPVLVLSARSKLEERVECLDLGADDFLAKPFAFAELSARIRALLRRCHTANEAVLEVGDLKLDRLGRMVERGGRRIELTAKEFALLEYMMKNVGRRITRAMIAEHVWGLAYDTPSNLIDVYVAYLRIVFETALVSAEHLTFREFLQRLPESTYIASCKVAPVGVTALLQLDFPVAFPIIDLLLGGEGRGNVPQRNLTEIEEQILESIVRIVLRELQTTWQALALEFSFDQRQPASQVHRLMPPEEKNLCLSFEITMSETRGTLNLAMPAVVSNALLRKISADWAYQRPRPLPEAKEKLRQVLLEAPFSLELVVRDCAVSLDSLAGLEPGTVLPLPRRADAKAVVVVEGHPLFRGNIVRVGEQRAVRITSRLEAAAGQGV